MASVALLLLLTVIAIVFVFRDEAFDKAAFSFVKEHISPAITRMMRVISFLGNNEFLIAASVLLLLIFILVRERAWAARVAVSLSGFVVIKLLKLLFQRQRPDFPLIDGHANYGFPSGHGMLSVVFYGLLAGWIAVSVKNKWYRSMIISFLVLLVLLIGYSRIYLRVHYATDVLAGFCVGMIWLTFCLWAVNLFNNRGRRSGFVRDL